MQMDSKTQLIQQLADGRFHSGERLAELCGVSRAAVWKQIRSVKSDTGLQIDAVRGKGYRLASPLELLESERIKDCFSARTRQLLPKFHIHHTIDSTNSWLMQRAAQAADSGTVCLAEQQFAGKGRHGRQWVSPFGNNIYLSLLWRFELAPAELSGLSLAAGIGVLRTLRGLGCSEAGLKWPNDILWEHRKLAGLLLEVAGEAAGSAHVVIGVGLNIKLGSHGESIDQPWIDLESIPGVCPCSRNELVASLLENLLDVITEYQQTGLAGFLSEWNRYDLLKGSQVVLHSARHTYQGRHLGIDESGGIQLQIDGKSRTFFAGEVSLRGLPNTAN
jgi:BirA family biotin operon repressor/biotin-[acetyl-CoA-carboxylase] ligase